MDRKRLVKDLIKDKQSDLTASERKVTALLQDDSMVAGLQSITKLAEDAGVSTPTIIRLARKLGFEGFPDLQNAIRDEVAARMREPLAKLEMAERADHQDHIVSRFAVAMAHNINRTIDRLDLAEFDEFAIIARSHYNAILSYPKVSDIVRYGDGGTEGRAALDGKITVAINAQAPATPQQALALRAHKLDKTATLDGNVHRRRRWP